jgi:hypothetical protein
MEESKGERMTLPSTFQSPLGAMGRVSPDVADDSLLDFIVLPVGLDQVIICPATMLFESHKSHCLSPCGHYFHCGLYHGSRGHYKYRPILGVNTPFC